MTKWFALVAFITGMLLTKEWKNIRKLGKEDLVIGILAGIFTIAFFSLMFAVTSWIAHKFPVFLFGGFGIYLVYRIIRVRLLPKHKEKKNLR
ncbi:MAG: hypothetical protein HFJ46_06005 [Clostridia bacterium]|nr:hypothetical protein [Clostridia bacterium]